MFGGHSDLDHLRYTVEICNIVALQFWLVAERAQIKSSNSALISKDEDYRPKQ